MTTALLILLLGGVLLGPVPTGSETPGGFNGSLLSYWVGVFLLSLSQLLPSYYVIWHIKALPADSLDKGAGFDWTERLLWGGFILVIAYLLINLALIFFHLKRYRGLGFYELAADVTTAWIPAFAGMSDGGIGPPPKPPRIPNLIWN